MPALHVWYRGVFAGEFVREGSAVSLRYDSCLLYTSDAADE